MTDKQPPAGPPAGKARPRALGAAAIIAALTAAMPLAISAIKRDEGKRNNPYLDTVGVPTVCYGNTLVPMRRYSDEECDAQLDAAIMRDFGPAVLRCTPGIADKRHVLAAAISFAYNIGITGYCRSNTARLFNAGELRAGCNAFMGWRRPPEIINHRRRQVARCLWEFRHEAAAN